MDRADSRAQGRLRKTRQGDAILDVVRRSTVFRSAQDIYADLRASGVSVGLTTVYRHLQLLNEQGLIDAIQSADGQIVYRHCQSGEHHHHVVCRRCGKSEEIAAPEVERWVAQVARRLGYADVGHTLEIFGICASCAAH